uniref:Uncharacterized protein n=1 Tax=Chrysotila carterae TaxID=13221 RepID=A0A7S4FAC8_CHRCT
MVEVSVPHSEESADCQLRVAASARGEDIKPCVFKSGNRAVDCEAIVIRRSSVKASQKGRCPNDDPIRMQQPRQRLCCDVWTPNMLENLGAYDNIKVLTQLWQLSNDVRDDVSLKNVAIKS